MVEPERRILHKEGVRAGGSVSTALLYAFAAMANFLNLNHRETKDFVIGGNYTVFNLPFLAIDGSRAFDTKSEIANIWVFNRVKGTSGTTELDIKWKAKNGTDWVSIFAGGGVTPKISSTANNYDGVEIGDVKTGFVAPVPVKTTFDAGDMIRVDLISVMGGAPSGCNLVVSYRPI